MKNSCTQLYVDVKGTISTILLQFLCWNQMFSSAMYQQQYLRPVMYSTINCNRLCNAPKLSYCKSFVRIFIFASNSEFVKLAKSFSRNQIPLYGIRTIISYQNTSHLRKFLRDINLPIMQWLATFIKFLSSNFSFSYISIHSLGRTSKINHNIF